MAALTRIFNNQIYNSTIVGYQKIAPGTITGSLFASNVTVPGDLLIAGNLFVLGSSAYTTIASTNTYVNDPLVVLNNGFSGTNTYDEGLVFNRGTLQNQAFIWSEASKEFQFIGTTETGTTYGSVSASNFANLHVGNLGVNYNITVGTLNVNTAITSSSLNLSGNLLASTSIAQLHTGSTATFGNVAAVTVGNVGTQFNGSAINLSGNVLAAAGVFNAMTVNGNETVTGYLNVTGNVMAAVVTASQLNTTGNVLATAGTFNALTVNGNETVTGYLNVTGNIISTGAIHNSLTVNGNETISGYINAAGNISTPQLNAGQINTTGNVLATAGTFNALTVNGNESVTGYLNVTGNVVGAAATFSTATVNGLINTSANILSTGLTVFGNTTLGLVGQVSGSWTTVYGNITQTSSGGPVYFNTTGNVSAAQLNAGQINTTGNVLTASLSAGQINTTGNVLASAGVFNTLTVNSQENASFITVSNLLVGSGGFNSNSTVFAVGFNSSGNILATAGTFNALTVNGNESVTGYLNVTGNILGATGTLGVLGVNNSLWANASIATTTQGTGAIVVPNGGISVAGAANIAGTTTIGGATQLNSTLTVGGIEYITNTTNATEATGSSGALQIKGGASIAKDVWIGGNLYVSNIFGTTYQILTVQDPLVYFNAGNTYPYNYDIGFYSNFVGPNPIDNTGNVYQHTGIVRDNDNVWKFFSNVRTEPSGSGITFDVNTIYDPVKAGNLQLTYTQAATSTTTGALQVAGGAGIVGTVVAGQINSTGNVLGQAGTFNALTVNGNESVTGYLNVTGNVLTASLSTGQINTTGNVLATAGTFNALTVNGNESITGYLNVTGNVLGAAATFSSATVNGALGVTGLTTTAGVNSSANILATGGVFNSLTVNGNESVTGYLNVTGNVLTASLSAGQINTTGNVLATAGVFNAITVNGNESVTGYLNVTGNVMAAVVTASQLNTTGNVVAQNGVLNGLTVNGNEAVTGYLNVTGNVLGAAATFSSATVNGLINSTGNIISTGAIHNSLTVNGNGTITGYMNVTGNVLTTRLDTTAIGATGVIYANGTAETTSVTTGAIIVPTGGVSVAGNVSVGHNLYIGGANAINSTFSTPTIVAIDSGSTYTQIAMQNLSSSGSADYAAYADNGSDAGGWVDMGIAGSAFSDANYTITKPQDGYVFTRATGAGFGGNLVLATSEAGGYNDIVLGVGSFLSTAEVARFHGNVGNNGNAWIKYQTVSTTPLNGALRVDGGVGIGGNIRVAGGAVVNNSQTADPFQVKGVATTSLIYADTAYGAVIIGGSNVAIQRGSTLKVNGTDSLLLPIGSTGQRPGATGNVDIAGMIRFNTTIQNMEFYDGSQWQTAGSVFTVISDRQFTGNVGGGYGNVDGTNKTFTIQANSTTSGTIVSINGVIQFPTLAYDVSGTTLTFTEPPAPDDVIDVRVLTTTSTISALANGNGLNQVVAGNDGVQIWTGTNATLERVLVNQAGDVKLLDNNKLTYNQTAINVPTVGTPVTISSWSQSAYTSAKYQVTAKVGATNFETYEAQVLTDGAGNAYISTYGVVNNGTTFGTLSANVVSGNVNLWYTSTIAQANVKAFGTYIV